MNGQATVANESVELALEPLGGSTWAYEERERGASPDVDRVEELRHWGLRPEGARRIEKLERTLNLPDEEDKLARAWAVAICRSDLAVRERCIANVVCAVRDERISPYAGLQRLQLLEIAPQEWNFAHLKRWDFEVAELICYDASGEPAAKYNDIGCEFTDAKFLWRYSSLP